MSKNDAALAKRWYDAWNARDVGAILALYAEEIEFSSPFVSALGFGREGVIHGKGMFRAYVEAALPRVPALSFAHVALCGGARGHTLIYRINTGVLVAEMHELDGNGLIVRADASYETSELPGA
ncbi:MAG: nuclear transport factor 2 family protein [Alphaproteobacteria bacterium]|nr:nuclear transport factor 2 family protein [Alphaproteobacteria bacterium]